MSHSIFNTADRDSIIKRISTLTPASQAAWGTMNVGQMLAHCNEIHKVVLGKELADKRPNFLLRFIIKKIVLSPKPYKQGLPTGRSFVMTNAQDFHKEKQEMFQYLGDIAIKGPGHSWPPHPAAGKLTGNEWGYALWKHLDHHLRQFSA